MPYIKSLGLVFVAIPKTGTTSMTRALRQIPGYGKELELVDEVIDPVFRARYRLEEIGDKKPGRAKHLSAIQLKYVLGESEFDRCVTFSLVRNPWARMVSRYFFTHVSAEPSKEEKLRCGIKRQFHDLPFEAWVERVWKKHKRGRKRNSQLRKLVDLDGRLIVDHVGKLEKVQDTLNWIGAKLKIEPLEMPHINATNRGHYTQYYTPLTRDMVAEICRQDIECFDYSFDTAAP